MHQLIRAIETYALRHANASGLAVAPMPGVRMKVVARPSSRFDAVYRPLVCLILQGAKHLSVGSEERLVRAGQTLIVSADVPVAARIVEASPDRPYIALAIDLDVVRLREVALRIGDSSQATQRPPHTLFAIDTEAAALDCAARLLQLVDRPDAIPLLQPGIMQELHYWLLAGPHGTALRALANPGGYAHRLVPAIAILQAEYRSRITTGRLAAAVAMSASNFYKYFKQLTSLTPGKYQKHLRLIEALRLMSESGCSASSAAMEVGYESVSQFTREYRRHFQAPPKRDSLRRLTTARRDSASLAAATTRQAGQNSRKMESTESSV
ncbi:AraC family transcriptional regulator [Roseomonas stagni]|uniref:AraC family transcriptional regulator n=1 Tax=Falsiroseomonas algicola TaxID=2716930 RepID=A0A6M1LV30_9PROT|nr:AraC family transcriptional regulator [Falsiroseomonas algicola]NGM24311.1 AraC family transcriptional regulator [Falsiroseomonas algicola]